MVTIYDIKCLINLFVVLLLGIFSLKFHQFHWIINVIVTIYDIKCLINLFVVLLLVIFSFYLSKKVNFCQHFGILRSKFWFLAIQVKSFQFLGTKIV